MTRRRAAFRLRRKFGRSGGAARLRGSVTAIQYHGRTIILSWSREEGFVSEVVGDPTPHVGPSRDAAIAKAKRAIDALEGR